MRRFLSILYLLFLGGYLLGQESLIDSSNHKPLTTATSVPSSQKLLSGSVDSLHQSVTRLSTTIEKNSKSDLFQIAATLCTLFTAFFAAFMTYQQWRTSKVQKAIALFEKRFRIYDIIDRTMVGASISTESLVESSPHPELGRWPTYLEFYIGISGAKNFFKPKIWKKIEEINAKLEEDQRLQYELKEALRLVNIERQNKCVEAINKLQSWFKEERQKLEPLFDQYFNFKEP